MRFRSRVGRLDFRSSDFLRDALRRPVGALAGTAAPLATPLQLHTSSPPSRALLAEPVQLGPVEAYRGGSLLGTDRPQQRYPGVGEMREVKHLAVDAAHMVAVVVDSMKTSTNEKH